MNKKIFLFFAAVLALTLAGALIFLRSSLYGRLFTWRINFDLPGFKMQSFTKEKSRFSYVERLWAFNKAIIVKIDRTKIADHEKYIEDRKFLFESLFLPTTSPYPEVITNIIECPDEFKPKERTVDNGVIYTLFAGERFNYGVCVKDLVKYHSEYGIFDCKDKGIFEVRIFSSDNKTIEKIMGTFKC